jgi:hypothetical protein
VAIEQILANQLRAPVFRVERAGSIIHEGDLEVLIGDGDARPQPPEQRTQLGFIDHRLSSSREGGIYRVPAPIPRNHRNNDIGPGQTIPTILQ